MTIAADSDTYCPTRAGCGTLAFVSFRAMQPGAQNLAGLWTEGNPIIKSG